MNEYEALETEYRSMTNRLDEPGLAEAIQDLLQELPSESVSQDDKPTPSPTHSVWIQVLYDL